MASRASMKARRPASLKRKCSPASPASMNSALEAVSKQLGAPKQARWSANSWYCSGCGMRGSIHARTASAAANSHRPSAFLSIRNGIEKFSIDGEISAGEAAEDHLADRTGFPQRGADGPDRDPRGELQGEKEAARFSESGGRGIVLRFGGFYGVESNLTTDMISMMRRRLFVQPGSGSH